jgi:hypothetical protein
MGPTELPGEAWFGEMEVSGFEWLPLKFSVSKPRAQFHDPCRPRMPSWHLDVLRRYGT